MVGPEEAVTDANLVIAAVVLVVADEDVQLGIEGDVVDVSQAGREHVQIAAIGAAAEDAVSLEDQPVPLGPPHVATVVAQGQVEPAVTPLAQWSRTGFSSGGRPSPTTRSFRSSATPVPFVSRRAVSSGACITYKVLPCQ